jgi:hypothetical protein
MPLANPGCTTRWRSRADGFPARSRGYPHRPVGGHLRSGTGGEHAPNAADACTSYAPRGDHTGPRSALRVPGFGGKRTVLPGWDTFLPTRRPGKRLRRHASDTARGEPRYLEEYARHPWARERRRSRSLRRSARPPCPPAPPLIVLVRSSAGRRERIYDAADDRPQVPASKGHG